MNTWRQRLGWNIPPAELSISDENKFLGKLLKERQFFPEWRDISDIVETTESTFGWEMRFSNGPDIIKVFTYYLPDPGRVFVYTDAPGVDTQCKFPVVGAAIVYIQKIADDASRGLFEWIGREMTTASKKLAWDKEFVSTIAPVPEWQKYFDALDRLWTNRANAMGGIDGQYPELRDNPVLFKRVYDAWCIARFPSRAQQQRRRATESSAPIEGKRLLKDPLQVTQGTKAWEIARIGGKSKEEFVLVGLECSQEVGVRIAKISSQGCEVLESFKLPREKYSWRELINEAQWTARLNDIANPIQKEAVIQCQNCGDTRSAKAIGSDSSGKTITLCQRCNNTNVRQRMHVQASGDGLGYCKTCKIEVMQGVKYSHQGHEVV